MNQWKDSRIIKTKRPSFKRCFGRSWDKIEVTLPDGTNIEANVDTTWGRWAYFCDTGHTYNWYKISMDLCSGWKIDLTKEA